MRFLFALVSGCFLVLPALAQVPFGFLGGGAQVQGQVLEQGGGGPIPYANLLILGTQLGTTANEEGRFTLPESLPRTRDRAQILIRVSALGFRPDTFRLTPFDTMVTFRLERDNDLPTITVRGEKEVELTEVAYPKYLPLYLAEWQQKVVTCYQRSGKKTYQLRILEPGGKETIHDLDFGRINGISAKCTERLYVLTTKYAISFELQKDELIPIERIPRNDYDWLFTDCRDRKGENFLYERQRLRGMNKVYLLASSDSQKVVREYLDTALVDDYLYGVPMMDFDWVETMNPAPWWSANGKGRRAQALRHFDQTILYNNHNYNPYFFSGNQIKLVNFDEGRLESFTLEGLPVAVVPFDARVDRRTELSQRVIRDEITGSLYALARDGKGTRVFYLNPESGKLNYLLHFRVGEVQELVVRGGQFWLLGRYSPTGMAGGWRIYTGKV